MAYNILFYSASFGTPVSGSTATAVNTVLTSAPVQFKKQSCMLYVSGTITGSAFNVNWMAKLYDGTPDMYAPIQAQYLANGLFSTTASVSGLYFIPNADNLEIQPVVTSLTGSITIFSAINKA